MIDDSVGCASDLLVVFVLVCKIKSTEAMNFLPALMRNIGRALETAVEGIAKTGDKINNFLSRIGQWLRTQVGMEETKGKDNMQNDGGIGAVFSLIMLFAVVVVAAIFAKRGGLLRTTR